MFEAVSVRTFVFLLRKGNRFKRQVQIVRSTHRKPEGVLKSPVLDAGSCHDDKMKEPLALVPTREHTGRTLPSSIPAIYTGFRRPLVCIRARVSSKGFCSELESGWSLILRRWPIRL